MDSRHSPARERDEDAPTPKGAASVKHDGTPGAPASDTVSLGAALGSTLLLDVATDFGAMEGGDGLDADETLKAKVTVAASPAPSSRGHSPSPLMWSEPGWTLGGSFTFAPLDQAQEAANGVGTGSLADNATLSPEGSRKSSLGSSDLNDPEDASIDPSDLVRSLCETPTVEAKLGARSKLLPTAEPFAPKAPGLGSDEAKEPVQEATLPRTRPFPLEVITRTRPSRRAPADLIEDVASPANSPVEPFTPPPFAHQHVEHSEFDEEGHLLTHGAKYNIADEILQLQSTPLSPTFARDAYSRRPSTTSEHGTFAHDIEYWRHAQQAEHYSSHGPFPQVPFPSSSMSTGPTERGRSMSLASAIGSYPALRPGLERANTVAQLQSYFGPPTSDGTAPLGPPISLDPYAPGPTRSFKTSFSGSQGLSRTPSHASLAGSFTAPYPPFAHPEPFNLLPDDPLYVEAREIFVDSSCSSLAGPPTVQHRQTMAAHFDRAMHQLNPLASLYGLSQDAANHLLADPANSGVNEVVLKVAAMRGRQQQMASVQRSATGMPLPGPSPNNRKLNLYKTELCRSWEEKGSCRYGVKCQFAHGLHELREVARHPKFKSEICRTFWNQGSCPYGKRCCFIHAVPDANSNDSSPPKMSVTATRPASPSRTQARMTSTAVTGAPSRTFGPSLSELIGSGEVSSFSTHSSPVQRVRADSSYGFSSASLESSALFGLGMRERPGQAPPTYKEAPQSRLKRLASLSAGPSSTSLSSLNSTAENTTLGATPCSNGPHTRHDSAHSFFSSSSVSSAAAYSPLLARSGSTSSLSSSGGSPVLHRISKDWLTPSTHTAAADVDLDWPAVEELSLEDPPHSAGAMLAHRFPRHA